MVDCLLSEVGVCVADSGAGKSMEFVGVPVVPCGIDLGQRLEYGKKFLDLALGQPFSETREGFMCGEVCARSH